MGKRWNFLTILILIFLLSGCRKQDERILAVVTQVQIRCLHAGVEIDRCYTEPGEISAVLDCLRLQRSKGTAQVDPERVAGDVYEIRVSMSDGGEHIYRHRGGTYLSKDSRPWKIVDQEQSEALYALLWDFY